jgi:hypothetical protein
MVNENEKINLWKINEKLIEIVGKITIPININNKNFDIEFNVVYPDFPIPNDGILGYSFLL